MEMAAMETRNKMSVCHVTREYDYYMRKNSSKI